MDKAFWEWVPGEGALVGAAIHDGHELSSELARQMVLGEAERFREEDPYTFPWAKLLSQHIRAGHSRFEVDLNRPPEAAVYLKPEDCWGLQVWKQVPAENSIALSMKNYADFYSGVEKQLREIEARHGFFVVLDIHSYNHRRAGPGQPPADPEKNPDINLGTASCHRELWGPLIEQFVADMSAFPVQGRRLDVRENVKFLGGHFPRWVNRTFPRSGVALAIEFKKTFMDEWSGKLDESRHRALGEALASTFPALRAALQAMGGRS